MFTSISASMYNMVVLTITLGVIVAVGTSAFVHGRREKKRKKAHPTDLKDALRATEGFCAEVDEK